MSIIPLPEKHHGGFHMLGIMIYKQIIPHGRIPMKVPTNHVYMSIITILLPTVETFPSYTIKASFSQCSHGATRPPFVMFVE